MTRYVDLDGGVPLWNSVGKMFICKKTDSKGKTAWKKCSDHKHLSDKRPPSILGEGETPSWVNSDGGEPMYPSSGIISVEMYDQYGEDDPYRKYGA